MEESQKEETVCRGGRRKEEDERGEDGTKIERKARKVGGRERKGGKKTRRG